MSLIYHYDTEMLNLAKVTGTSIEGKNGKCNYDQNTEIKFMHKIILKLLTENKTPISWPLHTRLSISNGAEDTKLNGERWYQIKKDGTMHLSMGS